MPVEALFCIYFSSLIYNFFWQLMHICSGASASKRRCMASCAIRFWPIHLMSSPTHIGDILHWGCQFHSHWTDTRPCSGKLQFKEPVMSHMVMHHSDRDNWFFRIGPSKWSLRLEVSEVWLSSSNMPQQYHGQCTYFKKQKETEECSACVTTLALNPHCVQDTRVCRMELCIILAFPPSVKAAHAHMLGCLSK